MTKQEYYNLKERIGCRDFTSKWYNTMAELLVLYPAFKDKTLTEIHEYFFHRTAELETEIRNVLNVE